MPNSDSGGGHPTSFVFRTRRAQLEKRLGRPLSEAELTFLADTLDQPFEAVASRLESETPPTTSSKAPAVRDTPLFRQLAAGLHAKLKRPPSESELLALEATLTKGRKAAAFVRPADAFAAPEAAPPPSPHPPVPPAAPPPRALEPHVRADLAKRTGYTAEEVQGFELAAQRLAQRRLEGHATPPRQQAGPTQLADLLPRAMAPASTTTGAGAVSPALEGARQAVLELGARLEAITANEVRHHRARAQAASKKHVQKRFRRVVDDVAEQVHEALAEKRIGPRLQPYQLRCSAIYVQQEDLDDIVPDGWGTTMPLEASRLARRIGLPPAAVPLLCLLTWTSSFADASVRDKHECGAGFQVSIAWLARKLGCTDTWVKQLLNRLDPCARWRRDVAHVRKANKQRQRKGTKALPEPQRPQGPVYIHRFRRLVRYEGPLRANGKPASIWVDSEGRPHRHVDIRGVVYLTSTGRRALVRRASHHRSRAQLEGRAPTPLRPVGYRADVWGRGNRRRWLIAARLRRGRSLLDGGHPDELLRSRREIEDAPALSAELPPSYTTFFRKKHLRGPPD
ncbi:MAG: hypothetical protein SFW67_00705 [Myxococcaceae bacterium]|nr:hypothetical protein [Myxococcaceae bacterium]